MLRDNVVFQQGLEVLLSSVAEKECIHVRGQSLKSFVCGCQKGATNREVDFVDESCFDESELNSAEDRGDEFEGGLG